MVDLYLGRWGLRLIRSKHEFERRNRFPARECNHQRADAAESKFIHLVAPGLKGEELSPPRELLRGEEVEKGVWVRPAEEFAEPVG